MYCPSHKVAGLCKPEIIVPPEEEGSNIFENEGHLIEGEINPEYCNKILQD